MYGKGSFFVGHKEPTGYCLQVGPRPSSGRSLWLHEDAIAIAIEVALVLQCFFDGIQPPLNEFSIFHIKSLIFPRKNKAF